MNHPDSTKRHNRGPRSEAGQEHSKRLLSLAAVFGSSSLILTGCSKTEDPAPYSTPETRSTQEAIREYETSRTNGQNSRVELAFAELNREIQELEVRVQETSGEQRLEAQAKLEALKTRRDALRAEFTEARFQALLQEIKSAVKGSAATNQPPSESHSGVPPPQ